LKLRIRGLVSVCHGAAAVDHQSDIDLMLLTGRNGLYQIAHTQLQQSNTYLSSPI
jgi:hypothetical protein